MLCRILSLDLDINSHSVTSLIKLVFLPSKFCTCFKTNFLNVRLFTTAPSVNCPLQEVFYVRKPHEYIILLESILRFSVNDCFVCKLNI